MSAEPTLLILGERRRRGRPPAAEEGSRVTAWVPMSVHDRLIELASAKEISVSKLVCDALVVTINQTNTKKTA